MWPRDALEAVAFKFLREMELDDGTRTELVRLCQAFHSKIRQASDDFRWVGSERRGRRAAMLPQGPQTNYR